MRLWGHTVQRRWLWAHHPVTLTPSPGTPVGATALPPAPGPAVDGQSPVPNSLGSLHSTPKLERCGISASCYPVAQNIAVLEAMLLISGRLPPFLPQCGPSRTMVHVNWQGQRGGPGRESCSPCLCRAWGDGRILLVFPLHCLCISQVWCPQRQLLSCARELTWHVPGHVFLQFYNEICSFWDFP